MSTSDDDLLPEVELEYSQDSNASSFESSVSTSSSNIPPLNSQERTMFSEVSPRLTTIAISHSASDQMQWINTEHQPNTNTMSKKSLKRKMENVAKYLMVESSCDPNVASNILTDIWKHAIPQNLQNKQFIDTEIIEGLKISVDELSGNGKEAGPANVGGTRSMADQKALLTISSAISSGMEKRGTPFTMKHAYRLGFGERLRRKACKISDVAKESDKSLCSVIESATERKTRVDCVRQHAKAYVELYCHNDVNAHRVDSNEKKVRVLKDPATGKPIYHPKRVWEGPVTAEQKYQDFLHSEEYKLFVKDHPSMKIGQQIFMDNVCKCLKDAKEHSCVDQIMSSVEEYLRAIKEAIRSSSVLRDTLRSCACEYHMSSRNMDTIGIEDIACSWTVRKVIEGTCCPAIQDRNLSCGVGCKHVAPYFIPWNCVEKDEHLEPRCSSCGVRKFLAGIEKCPVLSKNDDAQDMNCTTYGCKVWEYCKIDHCDQKQWELHQKSLSVPEIIDGFILALEEARKHYVDYQWSGHALKRLMEGINPKKACSIFTDFSAVVNLQASNKDNSNVPRHAVLDIFLVYDGHRIFKVQSEDSNGAHDRDELFVNCAAHHFFGNTKTKGKTHNYAFHTDCLLHLLRHKEAERKPDENGEYGDFVYYIVTDNCAGQYKCRQNLYFVASVCAKEFAGRNVRLEHVFAQKYRFKGNWDAEGKVAKATLKNLELRGIRSPDALSAVQNLKNSIELRMPLDGAEDMISNGDLTNSALTKLMKTSSINERTVYYVTSSEEEYEQLCFGRKIDCKHVVYVERDNFKRGDFHVISGSSSKFHFRAVAKATAKKDRLGNEFYKLMSSKKVCACDTCLDGRSRECQYLRLHGGLQLHHARKKAIKENKIRTGALNK